MADELWHPFTKDPTGAAPISAAEAPRPERDGDRAPTAGNIRHRAFIVAMQVAGPATTPGAAGGAVRGGEDHHGVIPVEHVLHLQVADVWKEEGREAHGVSPVRG